jgi:acetyl-CoA carboxylase carboxyltransferase component
VYDVFSADPREQYDVVELLQSIVDEHSWNEYRAEFGASIVCGYARINGWPCGIVANQRKLTDRVMPGGKDGPTRAMNMPAVVYVESADKAARFIMDCNQKHIPLIFMHDTTGFMVGRDSEQAGIIRSGAKMVNVMSNSIVPKISLITGGSYGAGNYAMCGRAFDPFVTLAWPSSRCAVMSAQSAAGTLLQIDLAARKRAGEEVDEEERATLLKAITASYSEQQDIRYGAAREWVDRIIEPHRTREELGTALQIASTFPIEGEYRTGVLQT